MPIRNYERGDFEVPEDWCANLRNVYEAARATDAFDR
jgi:hypothetical protein